MKSYPDFLYKDAERVRMFFNDFLTKLATMQFEHSPEERDILRTANIIDQLNTDEIAEILESVEDNPF